MHCPPGPSTAPGLGVTKENPSTPGCFTDDKAMTSNVTVELILPVSIPVGGEDVEDVPVVTGLSVLRVFTTKTFMKQKKLKLSVSDNLIRV